MRQNTAVVIARSFEDAALLHLHNYSLSGSEMDGDRVLLLFADPTGEGPALLTEHSAQGIMVNSRDYSDALVWAKNRIFAARRSGGQK